MIVENNYFLALHEGLEPSLPHPQCGVLSITPMEHNIELLLLVLYMNSFAFYNQQTFIYRGCLHFPLIYMRVLTSLMTAFPVYQDLSWSPPNQWSGMRDSNPRRQLGRLQCQPLHQYRIIRGLMHLPLNIHIFLENLDASVNPVGGM